MQSKSSKERMIIIVKISEEKNFSSEIRKIYYITFFLNKDLFKEEGLDKVIN